MSKTLLGFGKRLKITQLDDGKVEFLQRSFAERYSTDELEQVIDVLLDVLIPPIQQKQTLVDVSTQRETIQRKQKQVLDKRIIEALDRDELNRIDKIKEERKLRNV